jgi:histone chaperone ASF1
MNLIEILSVKIKNNFSTIDNSFIFEIYYEVKKIFAQDFEIKIIYVISPLDEKKDQELDVFFIAAKKLGKFKMTLNIRPPDYNNINFEDIIGNTIILMKFCYKNKEFIRLGYFINNQVKEEGDKLIKEKIFPPLNFILRIILWDQPRITYFAIVFEDNLII